MAARAPIPPASRRALMRIALTLVACFCLAGLRPSPRTAAAQPPQAPAEPERPPEEPFPGRWMKWIFDPALGRDRPRSRERGEAVHPGDLELSFILWPGDEITAGEPLIARVSMTNPGENSLFFPFIGGVAEAVHFDVLTEDGRSVGRPYQPPPFRPDGPVQSFPTQMTRNYETAVNYWYHLGEGE